MKLEDLIKLDKQSKILSEKLKVGIDGMDFYIKNDINEDSFPLVDFSEFKDIFDSYSKSETNKILLNWALNYYLGQTYKYWYSHRFMLIFDKIDDIFIPYLYFYIKESNLPACLTDNFSETLLLFLENIEEELRHFLIINEFYNESSKSFNLVVRVKEQI